MTARMLSSIALVFTLFLTAGCSTTPKAPQPEAKPHWAACAAKGGAVMGIPGAAYSMATGGAAFVAGALVSGTACALADPIPAERHLEVPSVSGMTVVNFDFDSSMIRDGDYTKLNKMLEQISEGVKIELVGHACDIGTPEYNQGLSERRAEAVRDYLMERGIPESDIDVSGKGELEPVRGNEDEAMRAENRRVEIRLVK